MTAYEVITRADELAPNVFSDAVKAEELDRLEQRIRVDILGQDPALTPHITAEDLTPAQENGALLDLSQRDDEDPGGDEIENPGTGQETGEGDPPGEGSGSGTGDDSGSGTGDDPGDEDEEPAGTLALDLRYRDVYVFWMISMYYYHMGEYEEYQNKKAMFEAAWIRFERDVCIGLDKAAGYA